MRSPALRAKVRTKTLWRVRLADDSYTYGRGATAADAMSAVRKIGIGRPVSAVKADAILQKSTLGIPRGHKGRAYK